MISVKKLIEYISMESIIKKRIVIRLDENKSLTEIPEGIVEQKCFYKINYYLFLFIALSSKRKNKIIIDIKQIDWSDPLDHLRRFTTLNFKNNIFSEIKSDGNLTASAYIPVTVGNLKRHSLKDYWKAGLGKVWDIPVIRELAEFVVCIEDMKYDLQELPKIFYEDNIEIDLVDDDIMHHLEEFTLEKLYK